MISIERLSKTYPQGGLPMVALEEVSLEIPTGSVFGIVGCSGAGKVPDPLFEFAGTAHLGPNSSGRARVNHVV